MGAILPVVNITREIVDGRGVQGTLRCGDYECYTLERPWLDNRRRVSCIPAGTYKGRVLPSPKFGIDLPELLDVPGLDGMLWELMFGMLGMGGLRSWDKLKGGKK